MTAVAGSAQVDSDLLGWADLGVQLVDTYGRARLALDDELRRMKLVPGDFKTARVRVVLEVDVP